MGGRISISLYGDRADRFEEIRDQLEERLGYRPERPEALGHLMAEWPDEQLPRP